MTDAVNTLLVLFLGEGSIPCDDAADVNDNGAVDISDPIASLGYQFLGTFVIPSPGAKECGRDETDDEIGCEQISDACL